MPPNGEAAPRAVIFGCAGPDLSPEEADFFADVDPLGFILFARNVATPDQVRRLVDALRGTVGRADAPVLIDQEGGRVARLGPPNWPALPPAASIGALAARNFEAGLEAAGLHAAIIAGELHALGITVDCAPVLDVPVAGAHDVIGDRAFSGRPELVAALGREVAEALLAGGVLPVIKHMPGHGRAAQDSHHALPTVDASLEVLRTTDFAPFRALHDLPLAMTAHVVYTAIDPDEPATTSTVVIDRVIRDDIGFTGALLSDDLSMAALSGGLDARARRALEAGCDVALHCNGDMREMRAVAGAVHPLADRSLERVRLALGRLAAPRHRDLGGARGRLDELLGVGVA